MCKIQKKDKRSIYRKILVTFVAKVCFLFLKARSLFYPYLLDKVACNFYNKPQKIFNSLKLWMMGRPIRIAAVSYLNTIPFVYGINHSGIGLNAELLLDVPAKCSKAFIDGSVDVALIPAAELAYCNPYEIITNFCIGSNGAVRTVVLFSNVPIDKVKTIYLDSHSRSSVALVRLLAKDKWMVNPQWKSLLDYSIIERAEPTDGFVLIGDKVFNNENKFKYKYDLALEWRELTGLPFAFAVWVARPGVDPKQLELLDESLRFGVSHISEAVSATCYSKEVLDAVEYLNNNINFEFCANKRKALILFLQRIASLSDKASPD